MAKQVDHQERRRDIAAGVGRIAQQRGLQGVSFREVAAEVGMSVSLVQHYFGTKENLLIGSLDIHSARLGELIVDRLGSLGPDTGPLDRLRVVASAFLPCDDERRATMLVYHGFAAVALTDPALRRSDAFHNADALLQFISGQLRLAQDAGDLAEGVDPDVDAHGILSLVLGLSLGVLLDQMTPAGAEAVLEAHLARLERTPT
jgi:AcrR family transcriptional regulator